MVAAHYKKDDLLNCWTSSSDISGYQADIHEGHGTVGAGQGHGMGAAWARHVMCESALRDTTVQLATTQDFRRRVFEAFAPT